MKPTPLTMETLQKQDSEILQEEEELVAPTSLKWFKACQES